MASKTLHSPMEEHSDEQALEDSSPGNNFESNDVAIPLPEPPNSDNSSSIPSFESTSAFDVNDIVCGGSDEDPNNKKKQSFAMFKDVIEKIFGYLEEGQEPQADQMCGICYEFIIEKPQDERLFGILPMCNHCFCLECICKWRQSIRFKSKVEMSCPECTTTSTIVCPSFLWIDTKEEKDNLIERCMSLSTTPCENFEKNMCPFGNGCVFFHKAAIEENDNVVPVSDLERILNTVMDQFLMSIAATVLEEMQ